jgi:SIR2-like protein
MQKPLLSVIAGSGASEAVGIVGTDEMTRRVLASPSPTIYKPRYGSSISTMGLLKRALSSYYQNINFELLLHGAETLYSIDVGGTGYSEQDVYKPAFNAFMDISPRWEELAGESGSNRLASAIVSAVINIVNESMRKVAQERSDKLRRFIGKLAETFTVRWTTLNYDDVAEKAGADWFDGFTTDTSGATEFDGLIFMSNFRSQHSICHLHGSINYTVDVDEGYFRVRKFTEPVLDQKNLATPRFMQSGETVMLGPIVSGLRKAEKTTLPPFGYYNHALVDGLSSAPRLLMIGYGARDTYINEWLLQFRNLHKERARSAAIALFSPSSAQSDWPLKAIVSYLAGNNVVTPDFQNLTQTDGLRDFNNTMILTSGLLTDEQAEDRIIEFLAT